MIDEIRKYQSPITLSKINGNIEIKGIHALLHAYVGSRVLSRGEINNNLYSISDNLFLENEEQKELNDINNSPYYYSVALKSNSNMFRLIEYARVIKNEFSMKDITERMRISKYRWNYNTTKSYVLYGIQKGIFKKVRTEGRKKIYTFTDTFKDLNGIVSYE